MIIDRRSYQIRQKQADERLLSFELVHDSKMFNVSMNKPSVHSLPFRFQIQALLDEAQLAVSKDDVLQTKRQASKELRDKQLQEIMAAHHKQLTAATERRGAMEAELKNIIEQNGDLVENLDQLRAREQELKAKGTTRNFFSFSMNF